jgi:RimJ/RimL family protein N-acetyltransferase
MLAYPLGDGAELRALEPWQAAEFAASVDRARAHLAPWLAAEAQGRGLVARAVRRMMGWAVQDRGMTRVEWHTVPSNARSIAVAQRLGMRREGVLRQAFPMNGTRHDVEVWSLLASEWTPGAPG